MRASTGPPAATGPAASREPGCLGGKVALVTGGGTGIGRGVAVAFAREGARVALMGRRPEPLAATASEIRAFGADCLEIKGDVAREADVASVIAEIERAWERLDVVVNNAACYEPRPALDTELESWDRTLAVNLRGPYLMARAAFPALARSHGSVINVSSTIGLRPVPGAAAYCVSKAALDMLTRVLAVEWAGSRVRVNSILLGIVDTPLHQTRAIEDQAAWRASADRMHPLGRMGTPADAAEAAVYLASDRAAWTTGALLVVDGGISLV